MENTATPQQLQRQIQGLSSILQLEKEARQAKNLKELNFSIVNSSHKLLEYRQASLWLVKNNKHPKLSAVSGVNEFSKNSSYLTWLKQVIQSLLITTDKGDLTLVSKQDIPKTLQVEWDEWLAPFAAFIPLVTATGKIVGVLWLHRDKQWANDDIALLRHLASFYAQNLDYINNQISRNVLSYFKDWLFSKWLLLVFIIGLTYGLAQPVTLSVLAPAQVIALNPATITAPVQGVIKQVFITPNSQIKAGDKLFSFDDTSFRNKVEIAKQSLAIAKAEYRQARQKSFSTQRAQNGGVDNSKKVLRARIKQKVAEIKYYNELLQRTIVTSPIDGLALFNGMSDKNELIGKPLSVGEKVMSIATPAKIELELWVAIADAINLTAGAKVELFLDTEPSQPYLATLTRADYSSTLSPAGVLGFRTLAKVVTGKDKRQPRIGIHGVAKIYGEDVPLYYYLLRRPLSTLRQTIGM